jgi:hypothetical protein
VEREFCQIVISQHEKMLKKSLDQDLIRIIDQATPKMWTLIRQVHRVQPKPQTPGPKLSPEL